jgi:hypothetical protein
MVGMVAGVMIMETAYRSAVVAAAETAIDRAVTQKRCGDDPVGFVEAAMEGIIIPLPRRSSAFHRSAIRVICLRQPLVTPPKTFPALV